MHEHAQCLAHALSERPHCADLHGHPGGGISRRSVLAGAGAAGAGGLVTGALRKCWGFATCPRRYGGRSETVRLTAPTEMGQRPDSRWRSTR
jgi:hypothetical protein